jgi:hypothetical protein
VIKSAAMAAMAVTGTAISRGVSRIAANGISPPMTGVPSVPRRLSCLGCGCSVVCSLRRQATGPADRTLTWVSAYCRRSAERRSGARGPRSSRPTHARPRGPRAALREDRLPRLTTNSARTRTTTMHWPALPRI